MYKKEGEGKSVKKKKKNSYTYSRQSCYWALLFLTLPFNDVTENSSFSFSPLMIQQERQTPQAKYWKGKN